MEKKKLSSFVKGELSVDDLMQQAERIGVTPMKPKQGTAFTLASMSVFPMHSFRFQAGDYSRRWYLFDDALDMAVDCGAVQKIGLERRDVFLLRDVDGNIYFWELPSQSGKTRDSALQVLKACTTHYVTHTYDSDDFTYSCVKKHERKDDELIEQSDLEAAILGCNDPCISLTQTPELISHLKYVERQSGKGDV